jgi:segregation and condensation protein A
LYLIRKQNLDVIDIPIAEITEQYVDYINLMKDLKLSLAGEYLLMAAMLAEIKSRMLLPIFEEIEEEEDPRAELVRRLLEYERYRSVSEEIDQLNRVERDIYLSAAETGNYQEPDILPDIELPDLVLAFQEVLKKAEMFSTLHFTKEPLSVKERMSEILDKITGNDFVKFEDLFDLDEQRIGLVVTFLAILELMKELLIEVVQAQDFGIIHVKLLVDKETHD